MSERTPYFQYNGLSHFQQDPQILRLFTDTQRHVQAHIHVSHRQVGAIREAFNALMLVLEPGFGYRGTGDVNYDTRADNLANARNYFFETIVAMDPDALMGMDPTVSIDSAGITIEGLSLNGQDMGTIFIPSTSYTVQGDLVLGSSTIEFGPDLLATLLQISAKKDLEIVIGSNPNMTDWAEGYDKYIGSVKKDFVYPTLFKRDALQFMAGSTLASNATARFKRIDLYNVMRHLRLNKPADGEKVRLDLVLINGVNPEMHIQPWGLKVVSPSGAYQSDKSSYIRFYDADKLARLEPLLPYISHVDVSVMGEALPAFWTLNSEDVSYTYATLGFKFSNWARGVLRDQMLRRDTEQPTQYDAVLNAVDGHISLEALVSKTGLSKSEVLAALTRAVQLGEVAANAGVNGYQRRQLFMDTDMSELLYGGQRGTYKDESRAYQIVAQGRVDLSGKITVSATGEVDFARLITKKIKNEQGKIVDVEFSTDPMVVSQERMSFQSEDPVFTPKLQLNELGATRKPGCTCAYMDVVGKGAICSHIQAMWIQYCREHILGESTGIRSLASNIMIRIEDGVPFAHRISIRARRVIDEWETLDNLNLGKNERRVRVYQRQEDAYQAFLDRITELEQDGFTNAG